MASIHKDIIIDASPNDVWDAVRDFGAVHRRLVPGFVLDSRLDGDARIVTFANGMVARELLVDCDADAILRACVAKLSPAHREIINLVYYHEKSVEEAGAIIGIPQSTVKTRMFYARKQLAELLKGAGVDSLAA